MNKLKLMALAALFVSACATAPQQVVVQTKEIPRATIQLPEPKPIHMDTVQWKVVKSNNQILFTLDNANFQNLMINMTKTKEMLIEQKALTKSYKSYYEDSTDEVPNK